MIIENNWLNIALYKPQIPQNTGNIGRTCVGLNIALHIIGKPAFFLDDKAVRRAGLDYWEYLKLIQYDSFEDFFKKNPDKNFYFFTKKGKHLVFDVSFHKSDFMIFGQETEGLPAWILEKYEDFTVQFPMSDQVRSFNLSNTVASASFEAYRQIFSKEPRCQKR
ncbi:MAG TPA: tRNA (uridine(34)/cytosine(34)/5-carboxymethylaminomethyluridine(34)-2'-O)-methyltransferase TrmL [Spirochaetia bacterium]|nr:MAG: hypothetical protein A2Y41_02600 [Spirochaetes bacterium GWB1_36_13]HCL57594.1 tRNA (uridine(34)/cytosine(34)/5-carboxymethylaminomethyluridine(34)-2'-O)-methyltransferase TrmL [Spirochaetia bacterium]